MINIKVNNVDKSAKTIDLMFNKTSLWLNYDIVNGYIKFPHLDLERYFGIKPIRTFLAENRNSDKYCDLSIVFKEMFGTENAFKRYVEFITDLLTNFDDSECKRDVSDYIIDDFTTYMKIIGVVNNNSFIVIVGDLRYEFTVNITRTKFSIPTIEIHQYLAELTKSVFDVSIKDLIISNIRVMDFINARSGVYETRFLQKLDELLFNYCKYTLVAEHHILKNTLFLPYEKKIKVGKNVIKYDFDSEKKIITYSFHNILSMCGYTPIQHDSMIDYIDSDMLKGGDKLLYAFVINMLWKKQLTEEHIKIDTNKKSAEKKFRITKCDAGFVYLVSDKSAEAIRYFVGKLSNGQFYEKSYVELNTKELLNAFDLYDDDIKEDEYVKDSDIDTIITNVDIVKFIRDELIPYIIQDFKRRTENEPIFEITSVVETPIDKDANTKYVLVEYKSKLTKNSRVVIKYQKDGYAWISIIRPYVLLSLVEPKIEVNLDMMTEVRLDGVFGAINRTYGDKYKSSYNLFMMFIAEINKRLMPNYFTELTPVVKDVVINMSIGTKSFSIIYDYSKKAYYVEIESRLLDAEKLENFAKFSESDIRLITSIIKSLKIDSI